jgi:hypothetical protein
MLQPITTALEEARVDYILYQKALSSPAQADKLDRLRKKKPQRCFVVVRKPKTEFYISRYVCEPDVDVVVFRGEEICPLTSTDDPEDIKNEVIDTIVNHGEIYVCEECHDEIKTHRMRCKDCQVCLCTFCFVKVILAEKKSCPACSGSFLEVTALNYLDELVRLYKQNPRDMMTQMVKKKKMLPSGLKNIDKIFQSAMSEAKSRGLKFPLEIPNK